MNHLNQLDGRHLDLLKESANIGASHAATSLSMMLKKPIDLCIPSVRLQSIAELINGKAEQQVAASLIQVKGRIKGYFFVMFAIDQANMLIEELVPQGNICDDGIGRSAFYEVSNILCGSYLSALASFLNVTFIQSPPVISVDMAGAILSEGLVELSLYDEFALLIDAVVFDRQKGHQLNGEFLFLPLPDSLDVIFERVEGKFSQ
ncbi:chemotaxis protein CheC [Sporolactobacillus terrae]|uniref:CheY-P phosphatase CheC n=1 Tax=Sporolactobacillus terrae TaxID=269673 RepID=A0A410D8F8_9BACL|nr:chemotaxis protein CheC [Sporolactobacillus terrae]QAA22363.1 chemotaxis protein CheC [Sporolactobacillus terrae]QAA25339.1 chemotaxis protein CheC [Sporolactobacillus terrae]UAK17149.1 chemotaxis protein CheC [Sporolactobacillus terrae]BBN98679.1 CheY-P phosphatase CheC [Sporolactobacillus terrae]